MGLLARHNLAMAAVFILFVLVSSLMGLNMLIGVLCAVVTAVTAAEKEKILVTYVKSKLMGVLVRLDEDGNGTISKDEFDQLVHIPEAVRALEELGVDVESLVALGDHLFQSEDHDDHGGKAKTTTMTITGSEAEANGEDEEFSMS